MRFVRQPSLLWDVDLQRSLVGRTCFGTKRPKGPESRNPASKIFCVRPFFFFFVPALIRFNSYRLRVNKLEPDRLSSLFLFFWRDLRALKAAAKVEAKKLGRRRPDLLDDLSEKMSDAFWVWNASEYDIVAVTAFEAGF